MQRLVGVVDLDDLPKSGTDDRWSSLRLRIVGGDVLGAPSSSKTAKWEGKTFSYSRDGHCPSAAPINFFQNHVTHLPAGLSI